MGYLLNESSEMVTLFFAFNSMIGLLFGVSLNDIAFEKLKEGFAKILIYFFL